jgi:hypothetical protein
MRKVKPVIAATVEDLARALALPATETHTQRLRHAPEPLEPG